MRRAGRGTNERCAEQRAPAIRTTEARLRCDAKVARRQDQRPPAVGWCLGIVVAPRMPSHGLPRFDEKTGFMLALIAPAVVVLICFQILPILTGTNASFRDWHLHDPKRTWIGFTNYAYVLRDNEFLWIVLPNTTSASC